MTFPSNLATIRPAADYETSLGKGRLRIAAGHPGYCWNPYPHLGHEFAYQYLNKANEVVAGSYYCNGDNAFAADILNDALENAR